MNEGYKVIGLRGEHHFRLRDSLYSKLEFGLHSYMDHSVDRHVLLTKFVHSLPHWVNIIKENMDQFSEIGSDLMYQKEPYLRIARPNKYEDQIGIHRDTHYGASVHEWVLWIPLTDAVDGAALRILPGSHLAPDHAYPWTEVNVPEVERGSDKQWLGFRHTIKKMMPDVENAAIPVPCRLGQAILFNSACVHGQDVNTASWTRFSVDVRLVDRSADIQWTRGLHGEIYAPLLKEAA